MRMPADPAPVPPTRPAGPRVASRTSSTPRAGDSNLARSWTAYLADPRSAVLCFLTLAFVVGGGRKGLQALRSRRLIAAISGEHPEVADVEAAGDHGRDCLIDLFRLLGTAARPEVRVAAGRALARLWRQDDLIAEEEKAVVRRGFDATWRARKTYPRGLTVPIAIRVDFGVPFLDDPVGGVGPANLAWSYRIAGTERARLETWTEPTPEATSAAFEIIPADFATLGPHRLALQAKVKTVGLTDSWEIELPHLPFSFEFDPHLAVGALLSTSDESRAARFAQAVHLDPAAEGGLPLDLTADLVLRDPPVVRVQPPLPCDLAHRVAVEFEGIPGTWPAGQVVAVSGHLDPAVPLLIPIGPIEGFPATALDRPGPQRLRGVLTADPSLGWVHPDVRSIWPDSITTGWADVRVIRR